ncbi:Wzy polymerase domain-containing protein [Robbsia sp. KACC 23696]|uniref:PglL family O-oligosaccharyltransferase n=1 Tax=Robbsia sp. KACC 23696 TaxID=3149231 RepID=UPI00325AE4C7
MPISTSRSGSALAPPSWASKTPALPLACLALLVCAWLVPYSIVGHTYPIPTFYAEYAAFCLYVGLAALVGLVMWRTPTSASGKNGPTSPWVAVVPLALAAVLLLQTVLLPTAQPSMNVLGAGSLLVAALAMHAGHWLEKLDWRAEISTWIAWALLAGGCFAVFCQCVQLFHAERTFAPFVVSYNVATLRRPFGNMAQANHLATYISFALAASVYLVQSRRLPLAPWIVLAAVYSFGLALTVSRTPWLQVAVILLASLLMAWAARRDVATSRVTLGSDGFLLDATGQGDDSKWMRLRRWLIPVLTLLVFAVVNVLVRKLNTFYGWHLDESASSRFQDVGQISPRLALWKYGWTMFRTHPLLGVGWGEFPRFQYEYVEQLGHVEIANNSHDIVIDLLAKTGLVGGLIVGIGFLCWLWRNLGAIVRREGDVLARLFGLALIGVLAMHALVEYPQQYLFFLLPAAFLFGLLETRSIRRLPVPASVAGYAVVTAAGAAMIYPVLADYHRAETLYYGSAPEQQYRSDPAWIFSAWGQFGLSTLMPLDRAAIDAKLDAHRQAIALLPGEVVLRRYAILLALAGDQNAALDQVIRLKIFAESLHDWPAQLKLLYSLCAQRPNELSDFSAQLKARYGVPPGDVPATDDDDD